MAGWPLSAKSVKRPAATARVGARQAPYPWIMPEGQSRKPAEVRGAGRAVAAYNLLRFALLAVCLGAGYLAGLRGIALIVGALLVSGVLSWFLLRQQRIRMGMAVERTVTRSRARLAVRTEREDAYVDSLEAAAGPDQPAPARTTASRQAP